MDELKQFLDVKALLTQLVAFLPRAAIALLIVVAAVVFFRVTRPLLTKVFNRAHFQPALTDLLVDKIYRYAIVGIGLIMAIDQLGVNVTAALAGVGVVGIAIGFAAQDSVANVISGILIFWDKPFIVGDFIETEDEYGQVTKITLRTTRIRTPRNTYVVIPNKRIIDEVMENFSQHGELRVDVTVGIAYKEDIAAARAAILEAISALDGVLAEPAPDVVVDALADSSVNLKVRAWISDAKDQRATHFQLLEVSKIALDAAGIEIPFPHLQLFVDDVDERVLKKLRPLAERKAG